MEKKNNIPDTYGNTRRKTVLEKKSSVIRQRRSTIINWQT